MGREAKGEAMSEEINIKFRLIPERAIEFVGIARTLECTKCGSVIRRGEEYAYFHLSDLVIVRWNISCWPETRLDLKKLREEFPEVMSADGVVRETEKVKKRYEAIRGVGKWPGAGEAKPER